MVKSLDQQSRKKTVLGRTINQYIREAAPVSSEAIAREFGLSSATIRNIFSELEEDGYLTHPYTSGGRIPTKNGYRYFVDFLFSEIDLLDEEKSKIIQEYNDEIDKLEDVLDKTSDVISAITHYAGITSLLEWHDRFFYKGISQILNQPEFQDLEKIRLLIKMLEEKRRILEVVNRDFDGKVKVYIGEELGFPEIDNCALIVSTYSVKNKPLGRVAVLGPMRMQYHHTISALEYISEILTETIEKI
ncbi:MAG: hypothetical protein HZC15_04955 [Candidatus Omnitrophica bacterium]|nr:hypothetical protein [Candidatus Omnitrophota bacterium]